MILSFLPYFFLDIGVEWLTGRSYRPYLSVAWLLVILAAVGLWSGDIGFRKSAILLLFVPIYGIVVQSIAISRICSLPKRYWGSEKFPDRWTIPKRIFAAVGIVLSALSLYGARDAKISFDRTFEESVAVSLRSSFALRDRQNAVFLSHHKGLGFLVKQEGNNPNTRQAVWWAPEPHWYGTAWAPVHMEYRRTAGFSGIICYQEGRYPYCLANLPEEAAYFELEAGAKTYSGSATSGVGVVFAEPQGDFVAWRAFNSNGVLIAGYSFARPGQSPTEPPGEATVVTPKTKTPAPSPSPS